MSPTITLERRESSILRTALSLPVVIGGLLACFTFCFCVVRFSDPDLWWHLKIGREIWETHVIPRSDHWSFTVLGNSWVPHEWVSQLIIYLVYAAGGYRALQFLLCILAAATVAVMYTVCYRYCGDARIAGIGAFLVFFFGTMGFAIRAQLFGYLFLALQLLVMERAWAGKPRLLWWLPPLFVVWVNSHGSYALGLGILAIAAACQYLAARRGVEVSGPGISLQVQVLAATAAALFCNPVGWKLVEFPISVFFKERTSLGFITEWFPLSLQDVRGVALYAILGAMGAAGLMGKARATAFELLAIVPVTLLSIQHMRMVFVFGIVCAPVVCRMLANERFARVARARKRDHLPSHALLLAAAVLLCVLVFPGQGKLEADVDAQNPVHAVKFIRNSGLPGPLLNDYTWGGYLVWTMPERPVFIDGRGDIYDWGGILAKYRDWFMLQTDPAKLLDEYKIQLCLISTNAPVASAMPHLAGWKKVYADSQALVFARGIQ